MNRNTNDIEISEIHSEHETFIPQNVAINPILANLYSDMLKKEIENTYLNIILIYIIDYGILNNKNIKNDELDETFKFSKKL